MTTQEKIEVMQACLDGKKIEVAAKSDLSFWVVTDTPAWNWEECVYRIKPEQPKPKVRPYKDAEELMAHINVHGSWVKDKEGNYYTIGIIASREGKVLINGNNQCWYLENVTFADGAPFGIEEGGEE